MAETKLAEGSGSAAFIQALGAEFSRLQSARGATISESASRSSLYMTTLSGAIVALALVAQAARFGETFFIFALAVLPVVFFLGVVTYYRLLQTGVEDVVYARGVVNSVVAGVLFGLMFAYVVPAVPALAIGVGGVVALALAAAFLIHQWRTWMRVAKVLPMAER